MFNEVVSNRTLTMMSNTVIHCNNKEEAKQLWDWFSRNGFIRNDNPSDSSANFISCMPDYGIAPCMKTWVPINTECLLPRINFSELNFA